MIVWRSHEQWMEMVNKAVEALKPHLSEFDSFIACGFSGNLLAAPVAVLLNVPLFSVRQRGGDHEGDASTFQYVRDKGVRFCFIDDHVAGGTTFRACREALGHQNNAMKATYEQLKAQNYDDRWIKDNYGEQYLPKNWPKAKPESEYEIVATYLYNDTGGYGRPGETYYNYISPDHPSHKRCGGFWPDEVIKTWCGKSPAKEEVVEEPVAGIPVKQPVKRAHPPAPTFTPVRSSSPPRRKVPLRKVVKVGSRGR